MNGLSGIVLLLWVVQFGVGLICRKPSSAWFRHRGSCLTRSQSFGASIMVARKSVQSPGTVKRVTEALEERIKVQDVSGAKASLHKEQAKTMGLVLSKLISKMNGRVLEEVWRDCVLNVEDKAREIDHFTHTAAMSALSRYGRHEIAVETFEAMKVRGWNIDVVTYVAAARAAAFCLPFTYTISLLHDAHRDLGAECGPVLRSAVATRKFVPAAAVGEKAELLRQTWEILRWAEAQQLPPSAQLMDSALIVACTHGAQADCDALLQHRAGKGLAPTAVTFNILLDHHAERKDRAQAHAVVRHMHQAGLVPDSTTFNTLLKLCVNAHDVDGAQKVVAAMQNNPAVMVSNVTLALLLRLQRACRFHDRDRSLVASLVSSLPVQAQSSGYQWESRIGASNSTAAAIALFEDARHGNQATPGVQLALAQRLARGGDSAGALARLEEMLASDAGWDAPALALAVRLALSARNADKAADFVRLCLARYPHLLTSALWGKVLQGLQDQGHALLAADLLTNALRAMPDTVQVVSKALTERLMRSLHNASPVGAVRKWRKASAVAGNTTAPASEEVAVAACTLLCALCEALQKCGTGGRRLESIVFPFAFNDALRMLEEAGRADLVPGLFAYMRAEYRSHAAAMMTTDAEPVPEVSKAWRRETVPSVLRFRPSNFTIAALVRNGKQRQDMGLIEDTLRWAMDRKVTLPFYAISDALSFIYSMGKTEQVACLYEALYRAGHISHWAEPGPLAGIPAASDGPLVLDLHEYSRAMAYAAITVAMAEARAAGSVGELVVIVGQGVGRPHPPPGRKTAASSPGELPHQPYQLLEVVQNVLIEDFYPPISSSTAPDNPGRVVITLPPAAVPVQSQGIKPVEI